MGSIGTELGWRFHSNLKCLCDSVTPIVETHILPKEPLATDAMECFDLADLWNQYYEWSACGAGTPVSLPSGETVVQYFVPYLSAIQLYTNAPYHSYRSSNTQNDCNGYDKGYTEYNGYNETNNWSNQNEYQLILVPWDAINDNSGFEHNRQLCFEYFELTSPYKRIPLADKVYELSQNFPALVSLKSVELSPYSWMSVAWYPIYHIPMKNMKELSTCFLTYHSLSPWEDHMPRNKEDALRHSMSLAPFGLATHKMEGSIWADAEAGDHERIASLFTAAESWLNQLGLQHHDFNYFRTRSSI